MPRNIEHQREYMKKYYQEHAEQKREYARNYHHEHEDDRKIYMAKWHSEHKEHEANYEHDYRLTRAIDDHAIKIKVLTYYGNSICGCVICGFNDIRALSIDHVLGNGNEQRRTTKRGGIGFYRWLNDNGLPEGYQTLCMNCQFIKRKANKEYK